MAITNLEDETKRIISEYIEPINSVSKKGNLGCILGLGLAVASGIYYYITNQAYSDGTFGLNADQTNIGILCLGLLAGFSIATKSKLIESRKIKNYNKQIMGRLGIMADEHMKKSFYCDEEKLSAIEKDSLLLYRKMFFSPYIC